MAEKEQRTSKSRGIIILFTILAVAFAVFLTDLGGIKTRLLPLLGVGVDGANEGEDSDAQQSLTDKASELEKKIKEVEQYENQLNNRQKALDEREIQLDDLENELERQREEIEKQQMEFEQLVKMYDKMEPAKAAEILERMEDRQLAIRILKGVKEAIAAEILSHMDSDTAAGLTKDMVPY
jgi:flagellar motility protein MotE (MotC chaperone)